MDRIFKLLPELQGEELMYVRNITDKLSDEKMETFAHIYRARRKDPQTVLILCIVGLFAIPGLQRFYIDQIGMGILYLFTAGLCFIGSIVDLINYQKLAQEYNAKMVSDILAMLDTGISTSSTDVTN